MIATIGTASTLPPAPFIVGADRSGTTLLQAMLDAHPDLAMPPETYWLLEAASFAANRDHQAPEQPGEAFVSFIMQQPRWRLFGLAEDVVRQAVAEVQPFDLAEAMRTVYRLYARQAGKERWGDKSPRYLMQLPTLANLFSEAHFIHLIRDGRDQALSILKAPWGPQTLPDAAKRWRRELRWARWTGRRTPHYLEIRYEDLVLNPEEVLRRVCDYIALPWHSQMLDYPAHSQAANNSGYLALTLNPRLRLAPQPQNTGRWRSEMTAGDVRCYEAIAGDLLVELGYELSTPVGPVTRLWWRGRAALRRARWHLRRRSLPVRR